MRRGRREEVRGERDEGGRLDDQWTSVEIPNTNKSQSHNELRSVRIKYTFLNVKDKHTFGERVFTPSSTSLFHESSDYAARPIVCFVQDASDPLPCSLL